MHVRIYADNSNSDLAIKSQTPIDLDLPCPPHKGDLIYINIKDNSVPCGYYLVENVQLCMNQSKTTGPIDAFYIVRVSFEKSDN